MDLSSAAQMLQQRPFKAPAFTKSAAVLQSTMWPDTPPGEFGSFMNEESTRYGRPNPANLRPGIARAAQDIPLSQPSQQIQDTMITPDSMPWEDILTSPRPIEDEQNIEVAGEETASAANSMEVEGLPSPPASAELILRGQELPREDAPAERISGTVSPTEPLPQESLTARECSHDSTPSKRIDLAEWDTPEDGGWSCLNKVERAQATRIIERSACARKVAGDQGIVMVDGNNDAANDTTPAAKPAKGKARARRRRKSDTVYATHKQRSKQAAPIASTKRTRGSPPKITNIDFSKIPGRRYKKSAAAVEEAPVEKGRGSQSKQEIKRNDETDGGIILNNINMATTSTKKPAGRPAKKTASPVKIPTEATKRNKTVSFAAKDEELVDKDRQILILRSPSAKNGRGLRDRIPVPRRYGMFSAR